jgi:hypothetical protein
MSSKDKREYLELQIDQLISRFDADRERHKKLGVLLKALTVSLAALVTVLLGWKVSGSTPARSRTSPSCWMTRRWRRSRCGWTASSTTA